MGHVVLETIVIFILSNFYIIIVESNGRILK